MRHLTALSALAPTLALGLAILAGIALPGPARAQFAPVITVNDRAITGYELEQRRQFLTLLNAPGDPATLAREQLIEERLKNADAGRLNITVTEEQIVQGMEEFAQRANLSADEFTRALEQGGVARQTFREFVVSGLAWRQVVRQRFAPQVQVTDDEVDRATRGGGTSSNVRVLLSEIIMPAPPRQADAVRARAQRISQLRSTDAFSAEARKYSATATRRAGGKLPWQALSDLPPVLRPLILGLSPGEVTQPVPIPNAVALFQLRAIEETGYSRPEPAAIEYATYFLPGGRTEASLTEARRIVRRIDTCNDLYGIAKGQPADRLRRETRAPAEIPADIGMELSKLDPGETSVALTRSGGQTLMLLMLCGRDMAGSQEQSREDVTLGLQNQRVQALADGYLAQLKADARIVER